MTEQGKNPGPDPSGPAPTEVERSLLADLLERSRLYHTSKDYLDLLAFVSRLRNFAPFNAMLLQIQRPGLAFAASEYDWRTRFNRTINEDARPLLIRWPFGPVAFVDDVLDTQGDALPEDIAHTFHAMGPITEADMQEAIRGLANRGIHMKQIDSGDANAGKIEVERCSTAKKERPDYQIRLNKHHDEIPGFGCRIFPSGKRSFILSYRVADRKRLLTIGAYGVLTLDQARTAARAELAKIETQGADPLAVRDQERQGETIKDLCAAYLERYAKVHKKSWQEDQRRIDNRILPAWGSLKVKAIKRADVAALHSKIGTKEGHPYEANRVRELVAKVFELAHRWGFVPDDHRNPAKGIDDYREQKRDRWVTHEELPRLAQAIDEEVNQTARFALWLYLLTGARKSELLRAEWDHIDWTRAELRLPDTKAGRVHYIPLSAPALALLREMPRADDNPFILPGKLPGAHLVNISKPWGRVRTAAGVADVRLHDLRRTVGSWLAQAGNSLHLIGRVLNHSNQSTTAVYARFGEDSVRAALEQHGARIMGAAGLTPSAEVTELPAPKARPRLTAAK